MRQMKKLFGLLLVALAIVACNKTPKDTMILSGKVENAKGVKEMEVRGSNDFSKIIQLKEDGTFLDTLQPVKSGYYTIVAGRAGFPVYLEEGDNLKVAIDMANRENPITFSEGKSVAANNYIAKKEKIAKDKMAEVGGKRAFFTLAEDKFLESLKGMLEENLKLLEDTKDLPKDFVAKERKTIDYEHLYNLSSYSRYHGFLVKDKDYKPSEKITKPFSELEYNNANDYENIEVYRWLVMSHFGHLFYEEKADKAKVIEEIKGLGIPAFEKDFAKDMVRDLGIADKNLDEKVALIKSLTSDEKVLKSLEDFLKEAAGLAQGKPSPKFTYKSIKGKEVKLEDLKGKLVYIDVWATWCGPCKGELPHLQKLEKAYHRKPVHFVSVSVDENKAAWEKMVKDKKLGGIQLHADKNWKSDFVQAYKINGIPRFILLDKQGNIISADAPRPSSDEIKPLLNEWLKK